LNGRIVSNDCVEEGHAVEFVGCGYNSGEGFERAGFGEAYFIE
jgi:hypothetical protein